MYVGKYDREREGDEKDDDEFAHKYVITVNYVNYFFMCVYVYT